MGPPPSRAPTWGASLPARQPNEVPGGATDRASERVPAGRRRERPAAESEDLPGGEAKEYIAGGLGAV